MLRKLPSNVINKVSKHLEGSVRHSALFINGPKAKDTFTYVTPQIDFAELIENKYLMQETLRKRHSDLEMSKVENLWNLFAEIKHCKLAYDEKKKTLETELLKSMKSKFEEDKVEKYKMQIRILKDNIKKLKQPLWSAEEAFFVELLKLPNMLHPLTPNEKTVLNAHLKPPTVIRDHHSIGSTLGLFNFKGNQNYYLIGDGALFELGAKFHFSKMLRDNNFIQFSNPDFVKSVIVEGCGKDHTNPESTFILQHNEDSPLLIDNRLHLVGGATLASFFAYHTKHVLNPKLFPLKYFTMGRQYVPELSNRSGLFNVNQSSAIHFFGITGTPEQLEDLLDEITGTLKSIYKDLDYHFRVCLIPAHELEMWESLKLSIEMFSTSLNDYVEVANISVSGDFICRRLLLTYTDSENNVNFPHILSGTILNVPKLLGCALENKSNFCVPDLFKPHNWVLGVCDKQLNE